MTNGYDDVRLPPHSIEAEQSVLGGLMLDNNAHDKIYDILSAADFYREDHRLIFSSITRLIEHNRPADVITVAEDLDTLSQLEYVGGLAYLGNMAQNTPSAANIVRYSEIVREKSILRQLAAVGARINESAFVSQNLEVSELLDHAESAVYQISEQSKRGKSSGFQSMSPLLQELVKEIDHLYAQDDNGGISGTRSGFHELDKMTCGLQPGDLIIVAGRPSMGKTSFAMNIAENIAMEEHLPVAVFSMEMGAGQLTKRLVSSTGKIDLHKLKNGQLEDDDWARLTVAINRLNDAPLFVEETGALTVLEIRSRSRKLARQNNGKLGAIVIDYMQLMSGSGSSKENNRATELGEISRGLKALAKELAVPVIALSQLSRNVESRSDKRPMMSDLRESGAIEQDADLVMFMYRDEYYNPDSQYKGLAECIIGKHRNGPTGKIPLQFRGQYARFDNADRPNGWVED